MPSPSAADALPSAEDQFGPLLHKAVDYSAQVQARRCFERSPLLPRIQGTTATQATPHAH